MTPAAPAAAPARKRTRLDHDERREQILAVARELFAARPYGAVPTLEIAEGAGVTRGLLHHYFGTKRALYLEVVEDIVAAPILEVFETLTRTPGAGRSWEESVDLWMDVVESRSEPWLVAIAAGETGGDGALHRILDDARERTTTQVIEVLGLHESDVPEIRPLVRAFGSFAEEISREWLQRERLSREQARVLLVGALPAMVASLLPEVARTPRRPRRRRRAS